MGVAVDRSLEVSRGENRSPPESSSSKLPLANKSCDSLEEGLDLVFLLELESDFAVDLVPINREWLNISLIMCNRSL